VNGLVTAYVTKLLQGATIGVGYREVDNNDEGDLAANNILHYNSRVPVLVLPYKSLYTLASNTIIVDGMSQDDLVDIVHQCFNNADDHCLSIDILDADMNAFKAYRIGIKTETKRMYQLVKI
jgi:hypothetical protein